MEVFRGEAEVIGLISQLPEETETWWTFRGKTRSC